MKLLKNKTTIGVIAIVLGILVCFILSPVYNKSLEQKTKIVRLVEKVNKGQPIGKDAVETIEVGSYNLPEDVVIDSSLAIGKYANTDLYKNDYLTPAKLSDKPLSNNEYLTDLNGKNGAISITLQSFASGLSGKLLNGDIVSILSTDINDNSTEITPELKYVKVLSCTTADGIDVEEGQAGREVDDETELPATVTLLVNDQQAKLLANLENTQKLHIELVYRGEEEKCRKFLEEQDKILEELSSMDAEITQAQDSDTIKEGE
jgi:pilus assembly protein CpaB